MMRRLLPVLAVAVAACGGDSGGAVGSSALSQGQVDFVRAWIAAGAPRTGDVVDAAMLANASPQSGTRFVPLTTPPAGQGIQIHVDSFGVQSNFERELFVYRPLGNA